MKRYRVWIEIEEHDDETDEYQTCDAPGASLAEYNTLEEAYAHAEKLTAGIPSDDVLAYITERCRAAAASVPNDTRH